MRVPNATKCLPCCFFLFVCVCVSASASVSLCLSLSLSVSFSESVSVLMGRKGFRFSIAGASWGLHGLSIQEALGATRSFVPLGLASVQGGTRGRKFREFCHPDFEAYTDLHQRETQSPEVNPPKIRNTGEIKHPKPRTLKP